ncbi:hypothetical protein BGX20_006232, partial [Mortierella sp. AD010]
VLPLAMNDVASGFNNRNDITLVHCYHRMLGFRAEDLQDALEAILSRDLNRLDLMGFNLNPYPSGQTRRL